MLVLSPTMRLVSVTFSAVIDGQLTFLNDDRQPGRILDLKLKSATFGTWSRPIQCEGEGTTRLLESSKRHGKLWEDARRLGRVVRRHRLRDLLFEAIQYKRQERSGSSFRSPTGAVDQQHLDLLSKRALMTRPPCCARLGREWSTESLHDSASSHPDFFIEAIRHLADKPKTRGGSLGADRCSCDHSRTGPQIGSGFCRWCEHLFL